MTAAFHSPSWSCPSVMDQTEGGCFKVMTSLGLKQSENVACAKYLSCKSEKNSFCSSSRRKKDIQMNNNLNIKI